MAAIRSELAEGTEAFREKAMEGVVKLGSKPPRVGLPFKETVARLLKAALRPKRKRDRRSGKTIDEYIASVAQAMESTGDPAKRAVLRMKLEYLHERMEKLVERKKTDRRSNR